MVQLKYSYKINVNTKKVQKILNKAKTLQNITFFSDFFLSKFLITKFRITTGTIKQHRENQNAKQIEFGHFEAKLLYFRRDINYISLG